MAESGRSRTCVRHGCDQRGQVTQDERCPARGIPTEFADSAIGVRAGFSLEEFATRYGDPEEKPAFIVTMNDVPGFRITSVRGDVFGLVVMSRDYFSNLGARLRTVVGGEVQGYTALLTDSRNIARQRLWAQALARGGNAVAAFRFDCNQIGDIMSEVAAYGTGVTVERVPMVAVGPASDKAS